MNQLLKVMCVAAATLVALDAFAVVQLEVQPKDVPAMRGATFEAISVEGEETAVQATENQRGGMITLDFDSPSNARGSAVTIAPSNGTPRFQLTIPMDWDGSPLVVDFENQTLRPRDPSTPAEPAPSRRQVSLTYGAGQYPGSAWGTPAGISRGTGNEAGLLPSNSDIGTNDAGVRFETPLRFGDQVDLRAGFRYWNFEGDDSNTAEVASGGDDVFSVFIGISDTYGTGFFGGPIGIGAQYDLDWQGNRFEMDLSWTADYARWPNAQVRPNVGFFWGDYELQYDARAAFIDVPEIIVTTDQQLDSDYWGVGAGVNFSVPLSQQWSIQWGGTLLYQDIESHLRSVQDIDLFGTPESIRQDSDDDDTTLGIAASVGVTYQFNKSIGVGARYAYEWNTSMPGGVNPISGTPVSEGQTSSIDYPSDRQFAEILVILTF
jgi:hypothetical protein